MVKTICRTFKTLKQAERFQDHLYNKYDYVRLLSAPMFSEEGVYKWAVN